MVTFIRKSEDERIVPDQNIYLTADAVIFKKTEENGVPEILLVKRKNEPFKGKWALPGGFVEENEDLQDAALRELKEETGLTVTQVKQLQAFGKPGRDPRGPTVTIAFVGWANGDSDVFPSSDADDVRWFALDLLPDLAFDHDEIVSLAREKSIKSFDQT